MYILVFPRLIYFKITIAKLIMLPTYKKLKSIKKEYNFDVCLVSFDILTKI